MKLTIQNILRVSILLLPILTNAQIISTVAGNGASGYGGDGGQASMAKLSTPTAVTFDANGNYYICEPSNSNRVRKVNAAGIITTVAGNGTAGYSGDGGQATAAALNAPFGISIDNSGNLLILDFLNNCIRKVNTVGIISTIAGNGTAGYSGDGGQATSAQLSGPAGIVCDTAGNIYFSDYNNNRVRMINNSGIISTVVGSGTGGFSGDGGQAIFAQLNNPSGISLDHSGNLYISDCNNNRIRKVNHSGIITTIAGTGAGGFSGDGGQAAAAQLWGPDGIVVDSAGNLYIADDSNNRIRKITSAGVIITIAGDGITSFSGDGGLATNAGIGNPNGICIDGQGNLFLTDTDNNRIRKVTNVYDGMEQLKSSNYDVTIYPNPVICTVFVRTEKISDCGKSFITIRDSKSQIIKNEQFSDAIDVSDFSKGCYFLRITFPAGDSGWKKFIVE